MLLNLPACLDFRRNHFLSFFRDTSRHIFYHVFRYRSFIRIHIVLATNFVKHVVELNDNVAVIRSDGNDEIFVDPTSALRINGSDITLANVSCGGIEQAP